ncbi:cyclin-like protein, partial [Fimicolochytrium jonesii]|uniref:cyclin-like protein n=1 Tax=Fimicolochytrium jonesii TaxID=1396493 RepID=UPI0022FEAEBC
QPTLTWSMRRVLINWLVQLHTHFNLLPETLFLTTHILDRFLSLRTVLTHNYHLVAVCALTLAAKFEQQYAPPLADLVKLAEEQYPLSLIITAERYILQKLEYDLSAFAGPVLWLRRLNGADGWDPRHRMLGKYLCELAMLEEGFVGVPASVVAAVAYAAAGWVLGTEWTETHTHLSTYTPSTLLPYVAPLLQCCFTHQDSAVGEKYAREEYFGIARTVPVYLAERGFGVAGEGEGVVGMDVDG